MTESSMVRAENTGKRAVLLTIRRLSGLCHTALPDPAIEREIDELEAIVCAVEEQWPLPATVKERIDVGPFAAKNIADWNAPLADALMRLDYALQHDGKQIDLVLDCVLEGVLPEEEPISKPATPYRLSSSPQRRAM